MLSRLRTYPRILFWRKFVNTSTREQYSFYYFFYFHYQLYSFYRVTNNMLWQTSPQIRPLALVLFGALLKLNVHTSASSRLNPRVRTRSKSSEFPAKHVQDRDNIFECFYCFHSYIPSNVAHVATLILININAHHSHIFTPFHTHPQTRIETTMIWLEN